MNTSWVSEEELSTSQLFSKYNSDLVSTQETIKIEEIDSTSWENDNAVKEPSFGTSKGSKLEEIDSSSWENDNAFKDPSLGTCKEIKLEEIDSMLQGNGCNNEQRSLGMFETIEVDPDFAIQQRELYNCFHCSAQFHYKSTLNDHIRTHTNDIGTKDHKCGLCGKYFSVKHNLTRHIRTVHSDTKENKCKQCGI